MNNPSNRSNETSSARSENTMDTIIEAKDLHKKYRLGKNNFVHALRGASIKVKNGEFLAIMGPSGSGKSTLMHILGGLDKPDQGEAWLANQRIDKMRSKELSRLRSRKVGFIFQGFNLVSTLTALENVALAAEYAGKSRRDAAKAAKAVLTEVGLADRMNHLPSELSGGQQQRVAIARALVNKPDVILGDEPTGDLDTATSNEIVKMMKEVNKNTGTTFVLVTHDPEVAGECERIIYVRDGVVEDEQEATVKA